MVYRNLATLEKWILEFQGLGYAVDDSLRVLTQDGDGGENTGLVAMTLHNSATSAFIQPLSVGSARWAVTFEARDEPVELTAPAVAALSAELAILSALCSFLEAKSNAYLESD